MTQKKTMKLETLSLIIDKLKKQNDINNQLSKLNVNLVEYVDSYYVVIETLIEEIYGEEGSEFFNWFCYENDFGNELSKENPKAWDKDDNPICYDVQSLWKELESINK